MLKFVAATVVGMSLTGAAMAMTPVDPDMAANVTVEQVKSALAVAKPDHPADFAGKSLRNLDLSNMDFTGAPLKGANLYGAKLVDANMTRADLTGANLNLSWLIHANFTDANLTDASLVAPVVAQGLSAKAGEIRCPVRYGKLPANRPTRTSEGRTFEGIERNGQFYEMD